MLSPDGSSMDRPRQMSWIQPIQSRSMNPPRSGAEARTSTSGRVRALSALSAPHRNRTLHLARGLG